MTTFGNGVREWRTRRCLSVGRLARAAKIDKGYLSKIENGLARHPSAGVAHALDWALQADGRLAELAQQPEPEQDYTGPPLVGLRHCDDAPLGAGDVEGLYGTIAQLIDLDRTWGGNDLHPIGVRAFRSAQGKLASGCFDAVAGADLHRGVAELAEVCGWLLYDADRQDEARRMFTEAIVAAQIAGDWHMEMFVRDLLAMQALHLGRPQEALMNAERALADERIRGRAAAIFHLRRGRALAALGVQHEAMDSLARSRAVLAEGVNDRDPTWTWWIHEAEMHLHEARALTELGRHAEAIENSGLAEEQLPVLQVRDWTVYRAYHIDDLAAAGAWGEAQRAIEELQPRLTTVSSTRVVNLVRAAVARPGATAGVLHAAQRCLAVC